MKKIEYIEEEDLKNIRNKIGYYFEGSDGYLKRSINIEFSHNLNIERCINLTEKIKNEFGIERNRLIQYLENNYKSNESEINRLYEKIKSLKETNKKLENITDGVIKTSTFWESFKYLLNYKV